MILIPEIETVVILVPRTGTGSLSRAVAERFPKSMMIYRHMEADGVPGGYDRWRRVGVVRHPLHRLWSLYKFCQIYKHPSPETGEGYLERLRLSVERPFSDWIVNNETVFTSPYDSTGHGKFFPRFTVRHALPENRKSQFVYLRPDLGTEIFRFDDLAPLLKVLDLDIGHVNASDPTPPPDIDGAAAAHMAKGFSWDLKAAGY